MSNITVDIGELCTHCFEDTSFSANNGKKVNRIPSENDAEITHENYIDSIHTEYVIPITINGWMCAECQLVPCDNCEKLVSETEHYDDDGEVLLLCGLCYMEKTVSQENN